MSLKAALDACAIEPGETFAVAAIFDGQIRPATFNDPEAAEAWLSRWDGWNLYLTGNPVRPECSGRPRAADVVARRVLLVDCDPEKTPEDPAGTSETGRVAAGGVAGDIWRLTGGALVDSGRGHQVWIHLSDGDDPARVLGGLRARFETKGVKIDGTHDASRLMRLPGSINQRTGDVVRIIKACPGVRLSALDLPEPAPKSMRAAGPVCFDDPTSDDLGRLSGVLKRIWDTPTPERRSERDARFVLEALRAGVPEASVSRLLWGMPGSKARDDKRGERYWVATVGWAYTKLDAEERHRAAVAGVVDSDSAFEAMDDLAWVKENDLRTWARERERIKRLPGVSIKVVEDVMKVATADARRSAAAPEARVRHVKKEGAGIGWMLRTQDEWLALPKSDVATWLNGSGLDAAVEMAGALNRSLELVSIPFAPEYPGQGRWNRGGAQLAYDPVSGPHPTWDQVLRVVGRGLDEGVRGDSWCAEHGISDGASYLLTWIAAVFQFPEEPCAYLFFFGPEGSGKSTLWEALRGLMTRGVVMAKQALVSSGGFNGELAGAVLAVVDDFKLPAKRGVVHNRLKEWVTAEWISIHRKGHEPYEERSYLHFIHCTNHSNDCPVLDGDTRITMGRVELPDDPDRVPKRVLHDALRNEAPAFLATVLGLEVPPPTERLRVPAIMTNDKKRAQERNRTPFESWAASVVWQVMDDETLQASFAGSGVQIDGTLEHELVALDKQGWDDRAVALWVKTRDSGVRFRASDFDPVNYHATGNALSRLSKLPGDPLGLARVTNGWERS